MVIQSVACGHESFMIVGLVVLPANLLRCMPCWTIHGPKTHAGGPPGVETGG
jgi:hypothetical protein